MVIITTSSDRKKAERLRATALLHCLHFVHIEHEWRGFLDKLREAYIALKRLYDEGHTHFIYSDAWDTVIADYPPPLLGDGLIFSAERACYPHPEKEAMYPFAPSPWHFVNGGGWGGSITTFIDLYEHCPPSSELNDQVWLTDRYLQHREAFNITLDTNCDLFQTVAFCPPTDFDSYRNTVTNSRPAFWHGNGHTPLPHQHIKTLGHLAAAWADTTDHHRHIGETLTANTDASPALAKLRDHIEANALGFGERCFYSMWAMILDYLPQNPKLLEIGVYKGQQLALWRTLSPKATIAGITPLDSSGGFDTSDYANDIATLHKAFKLKQPKIIPFRSDSEESITFAAKNEWDAIFIDGGHDYETAYHDIYRYSSYVRVGGFLVVDDSANRYSLPDGYFRGIESVSAATDALLPNDFYTEVANVGHNRIFKRIQ